MTISALVAIPAFGSSELTDAVLGDLDRDDSLDTPEIRVVVVDNDGGYDVPGHLEGRVAVHREGRNLRWIGSANWAIGEAAKEELDACVVLNNDTRLSTGFLAGLLRPLAQDPDVALVAACYDDFWLHQQARPVPPTAADYQPRPVERVVPFCDGTAIAFAIPAVSDLGALDETTFVRHGYGSDIDLAIRARRAGYRCVVTERAYVSHLRRATMVRTGQPAELNRAEIVDGMTAKWGEGWRAEVGLSPASFPAHNTGSDDSWYVDPPPEEPGRA